jgi:hypothetical protein
MDTNTDTEDINFCIYFGTLIFFLFVQEPGGYIFEFTTTQFTRSSENILVVNEPNIDRDPPNQNVLIVQVSCQ